MPRWNYGCLNTHCRAEFESEVPPSTAPSCASAGGPSCEICGGRTKWIPALTVTAPAHSHGANQSRSAFEERAMSRLVSEHNLRQTNPNLKIADVGGVHGGIEIAKGRRIGQDTSYAPAFSRTKHWQFNDASGKAWNANIPVDNDGRFVEGNSFPVPVSGQGEKVRAPAGAGWKGHGVPSSIVAACDQSGRRTK